MDQDAEEWEETAPPPRRKRRRWVAAALGLGALLLGWAWLSRGELAEDYISGQLEDMDLKAHYTLQEVGIGKQVLANVRIGDPAHPDLTVERIEVETSNAWGLPGLGRITLVRPRLYGTLKDGKLSFGALDPVLFAKSDEPPGLPDYDIALIDGRARIDGDLGVIGVKAEGQGRLVDGFSGVLAAVAPRLAAGPCQIDAASLFGKLTTSQGKPRLAGPLRFDRLVCPDQGLTLAKSGIETDLTLDPRFDGAEGRFSLAAGRLSQGGNHLATTTGTARFVWRSGALKAQYDLAASGGQSPLASLGSLGIKGEIRAAADMARIDVEGALDGKGLRGGPALESLLAGATKSGSGTLAAPLLAQIQGALRREAAGSRLSGQFVLRQTGSVSNLVVPEARVIGGSGAALLSVSRVQITASGNGAPLVSGNFASGGAGLPRLSGRMERVAGGKLVTRLAMAEYRAGSARIAVPQLMLMQSAGGALGFSGEARVSGDLPQGRASNLILPIDGNWSARGGLALWRACTPVRFDALQLANLRLERRGITLCPAQGSGAIVRLDGQGLRVAAGAPSLEIAGLLGTTPIRMKSGPFGMAWPGQLSARALDITLGPAESASHFQVSNLTARIGKEISGRFAKADVTLAAVPLDIRDAEGAWRFAGGRLDISEGQFRLLDREVDDRFQPLMARDATLSLADNRVVAHAVMREPRSEREIVDAHIRHNLANGVGDAQLHVGAIVFDKALQPDTLSYLALGVIANADGVVTGKGSINWTPDLVISQGDFSTDRFDFAAAFGLVKGVSGRVTFTDLLGLVTAPDQRLKIASINPGIEAENGELSFALQGNNVLAVNGAWWPFLDGKLSLEPTRMVLGASEVRRLTLVVDGLDAAKFVKRMQLANLAASGVFDGRLPLVFDENGGRIEQGLLASRPPGGNVSYVGELSYKDLSPMGNFAFDALKSLNYRTMRIDLNGSLTGELFTRVSFEGLGQGEGTRQNFLTKQVAKLPIKFNVNIRAPFFSLFGSFKSLYDPAFIADPAIIGLLDSKRDVQPPASEIVR